MTTRTVCILGGTGFIGYHLANQLVKAGMRVRIPSRRRERHRDLLVIPGVDVVETDIHDPKQLESVIADCDAVVNLVAILHERRKDGFTRVHVELPRRVVHACLARGVRRIIHISALHADAKNGPSAYLRSKGEGEQVVLGAHSDNLAVTVFRPSVVFGAGDHFFTLFAGLLRMSPGPVPLACPRARMAPVFVGDVVANIVAALDDRHTKGKRYELCGPRVYTLEQLVQYVNQLLDLRRSIIPLGDGASRLLAKVLGMLPGKIMTTDNYLSLTVDAVCTEPAAAPVACTTPIEAVVPLYTGQKDQRSFYDAHRSSVRDGAA